MSTRTNWPASRIAPMRTSSPPRTIDGRRGPREGWLMTGPGAPPGPLADGSSAMPHPYAGGGCRQGTAPAPGPNGRRRAEVVEHTLRAARRPGEADPAAVQDEAQAEAGPLLRRQHLRHLGFDFHRIAAFGQTEPSRQPFDVGVDREPRDAEGDAEHDVGGLATDARQRHEVFDPGWHLPVEALDQRRTGGDDRFGLDVEKPVGLIIASTSAGLAWARAAASGYLENSAGVTELTDRSVVCADKMVATSIWKGFVCASSETAGYSALSRSAARRARSFAVIRGLGSSGMAQA